jgi:hypothetical protein
VLEALQQDVLPGAGGAALVVCGFALFGRWISAFGSAVAAVFGFVWGNFTFAEPKWEGTGRLLQWKLEDDAVGYEWLLRAALLLVVVGLVSRWLGLVAARLLPERRWWGANLLVWAPRAAAVILASGWLTIGDAVQEWPLLRPQLALAMLLVWVALDGLARSGAGAQAAAYQGAMLLTGSVIFLHAHNSKSAELAMILGSALFGVAVATAAIATYAPQPEEYEPKFDTSGAVPAAVAFLPGLLLGARPWLATTAVPGTCFWLVALAPLVLLPFQIPALARKSDRPIAVARAILVLLPLIVAVSMAREHAQMAFE